MVDQQLGRLIETRPVPGQIAVVAAHATVGAVFAAVIGDLDDTAQEDLAAEFFRGGMRGTIVEFELGFAARR